MEWHECDGVLRCLDGVRLVFEDSREHFDNGFRRLLGLDEGQAKRFIELSGGSDVAAMKKAAEAVFGPAPPAAAPLGGRSCYGHVADWLVAPALAEAAGVAVVGNREDEIAWLVGRDGAPLGAPAVAYEEEYFEGRVGGLGYGDYLAQQGWRLEKARRFLKRMTEVGELPRRPRLLDIGSGYGFFRKAAGDAGWVHDGWEVSVHAAKAANGLFGFDTRIGEPAATGETYDVVTLWDVVEHVPDPLALMRLVHGLLVPGGHVFLRTPNLLAVEAAVFGWRYHSLKMEHLFMFSPRSLDWLLREAGFAVVHLSTDSHLLSGLLGPYGGDLRGSDCFACARVEKTP